ncbi:MULTISPECIES: glycerol-3-phosphate 1-O-acyltransferase PlsY [unclassified Mycoplasma]|uniref:glycerol-3-phosphate 1-O-acyltransferase PlsY n=1 Tax=unclassified Mycoplasma TaxID=2683645 RepID=UPI00211BC429|nr:MULTISPECIES: glycerol-3-phosphate 1-O-acyltransferase PlsY [unclassified Mycoplasma]UUM19889.1 glycerol-3-phosphate 1-O-acyltransferase PlsY [Mycoplasma sp. 1578d]UUM24869.1 glycerol-3-phosphate 1-O-acyltransferase PlsY [Mycoplasma sp. 3686d]
MGTIIFYSIIANLSTFLIGYLWGSLNSSIILSKRYKKDDVRNHYSKNAGATNSLRAYGKKFALIVLIIDIFKTIFAIYFAYFISFAWSNTYPTIVFFPVLAGVGNIFGHVFPVFFQFKGGKAVASSVGLLISINITLFFIAALIFFSLLYWKKMVSLASISTAIIMIALLYIPWISNGALAFTRGQSNPYWWINSIIETIPLILLIIMHHTNIKRLLKGTESKIK